MTVPPGERSAPGLHDDADMLEYRSLSPLAAVAMLLGLLSPAALATPSLLVIPVAAAGVALLALAKIQRSGGALTGDVLARAALALAIACAVAPTVRDQVRNVLIRQQTTEAARQWMTLLAEGQLEESRDWLSGQAIASFSPRSGEPGQPPPPQDVVDAHVLASLGKDALVQRLATMEPPLGLQAEGDRPAPTFDGGRTLVSDEFTVRSKSGQGTCRVVVSFVRAEFYERQGRPWRIERWTLRDDAGDST